MNQSIVSDYSEHLLQQVTPKMNEFESNSELFKDNPLLGPLADLAEKNNFELEVSLNTDSSYVVKFYLDKAEAFGLIFKKSRGLVGSTHFPFLKWKKIYFNVSYYINKIETNDAWINDRFSFIYEKTHFYSSFSFYEVNCEKVASKSYVSKFLRFVDFKMFEILQLNQLIKIRNRTDELGKIDDQIDVIRKMLDRLRELPCGVVRCN